MEPLPHVLVWGSKNLLFAFSSVFSAMACIPPYDLQKASVFCLFCFMQLLGDLKGFLIHSVPHGNVAASIAFSDILETIM